MKTIAPIFRLEHVSKHYSSRRALGTLSLTVKPGEFVAVIGRSGAGKTTLLRCLARFTPVTGGRVYFRDDDLATLRGAALRRHRRRVGMIYQQFNLVRRLRVLDNVLIGRLGHLSGVARLLALGRRFPSADRDIAARCLQHVGLLERAWQRTDTLSGGEQQRVAIAKILAQEPEVILADEPIASLDLANSEQVMDTLRHIATDSDLAVIATLHHVDFARRYADRVLAFRAGHLVFDGPVADFTDAEVQNVFHEGRPAKIADEALNAIGALEWVAG
ncbi:MAG TPA: phosphonate ABC transporter ATP-binding protein [Candidatus Baltobacteraceae bacterium]|nr:phosphonate ABC transporter ATP-binding protein [Candidatus Baltobacteraceae bacterium]